MKNLFDRARLFFSKDREFRSALYQIMGFCPHNVDLYRTAFAHKSQEYRSKKTGNKPLNNERLEFLGDAVLETVVSHIVYRQYPNKREGFLTNTRSKIVSRESLGQLAKELGIDRLIQSQTHTRSHNSYLEGNSFEALMGAIYLDRGYRYAFQFIEKRIIGAILDLDTVANKEVNFKSKLLEWKQKNRIHVDFSDSVVPTGNGTSPTFHTSIIIEGLSAGEGKGFSKKESHQAAAKDALTQMRRDAELLDAVFRAKEKRTAMSAEEFFALPRIAEIDDEIAQERKGNKAERGDREKRERKNERGEANREVRKQERDERKTEREAKKAEREERNERKNNSERKEKAERNDQRKSDREERNNKKAESADPKNDRSEQKTDRADQKPERNERKADTAVAKGQAAEEKTERAEQKSVRAEAKQDHAAPKHGRDEQQSERTEQTTRGERKGKREETPQQRDERKARREDPAASQDKQQNATIEQPKAMPVEATETEEVLVAFTDEAEQWHTEGAAACDVMQEEVSNENEVEPHAANISHTTSGEESVLPDEKVEEPASTPVAVEATAAVAAEVEAHVQDGSTQFAQSEPDFIFVEMKDTFPEDKASAETSVASSLPTQHASQSTESLLPEEQQVEKAEANEEEVVHHTVPQQTTDVAIVQHASVETAEDANENSDIAPTTSNDLSSDEPASEETETTTAAKSVAATAVAADDVEPSEAEHAAPVRSEQEKKRARRQNKRQNAAAFTNTELPPAEQSHRAQKAERRVQEQKAQRKERAREEQVKRAQQELSESFKLDLEVSDFTVVETQAPRAMQDSVAPAEVRAASQRAESAPQRNEVAAERSNGEDSSENGDVKRRNNRSRGGRGGQNQRRRGGQRNNGQRGNKDAAATSSPSANSKGEA